MLNIAATRFCLKEHSLEIYISGCSAPCKGCHNPQLWDETIGTPWEDKKEEMEEVLNNSGPLVTSIRIYGGEPLERPLKELVSLLMYLKTLGKEVWLFTRMEFSNVPKEILDCLDYIKCGPYDESQKENVTFYGVTLATKNQKIFKKGVDW